MEYMTINGQPVAVPEDVRARSLEAGGPGRAAVEEWFAKENAPHAKDALAKSGLKASDVTCTGFNGAMLVSDVGRAVLARAKAAEEAKAKPEATTTKAAPDAPATGEG